MSWNCENNTSRHAAITSWRRPSFSCPSRACARLRMAADGDLLQQRFLVAVAGFGQRAECGVEAQRGVSGRIGDADGFCAGVLREAGIGDAAGG